MSKISQFNLRHNLLSILLVFAMVLSYLAGTVSVEARFMQDGTRYVTINQESAVSAAVSLLLLGNGQNETFFLPLIMK